MTRPNDFLDIRYPMIIQLQVLSLNTSVTQPVRLMSNLVLKNVSRQVRLLHRCFFSFYYCRLIDKSAPDPIFGKASLLLNSHEDRLASGQTTETDVREQGPGPHYEASDIVNAYFFTSIPPNVDLPVPLSKNWIRTLTRPVECMLFTSPENSPLLTRYKGNSNFGR